MFCKRLHVPCKAVSGYLREMLSELKKEGIWIAVLSNKTACQAIDVVESLFGKDYFDCIQGQTGTIRRKPAPDEGAFAHYRKVCSRNQMSLCRRYKHRCRPAMRPYASGRVLWGFRDRKELEENPQ